MKLIFFFFQAEDGIRDVAVTGVQTCALPIYLSGSKASSRQGRKSILGEVWTLGQLVRVQAGRRHAGFQRFTAKSRHLDRKSTRLNSSHGYISYAVFCLKKKKKKRTQNVKD